MILKFKNGSGIHIKKSNRGKFTSYCGGKVTDECIRRGKNSSDPKIRKRATFAANARKWKHEKGGKAFVNGVSILDSNPDAYKYVKKKIKKAQNGDKVDLTPLNLEEMIKNYKKVGNNRYIDTLLLRKVDNRFIYHNVGKPQREAIAWTVQQEGNTTKAHGNGAYGLVGWRNGRAENLPDSVEGQADKLYNELYGPFNGDNWYHGGSGSGYQTAKDAQKAFQKASNSKEAAKALNFGYVRPPKEDSLYRFNTITNIFKNKKGGILKAQDGTKLTGLQNFFNNYGSLIQQGLSYFSNKPKSTKADKEAFIKNYIAQNSVNPNQFYQQAYQQQITSPDVHASDIVASNSAYKLAQQYNAGLQNEANAAWAQQQAMQKQQSSGNNLFGTAFNLLGKLLGPKQTDGQTEVATTPEKAIQTTASPSLAGWKNQATYIPDYASNLKFSSNNPINTTLFFNWNK